MLAAIRPYTQDMDDTVATNLLALYQNELNGTYVAFSENAFTQGSAATFLNANTDYVRIDGPTVWIEFVCQNGVVFTGIHYHSVWRDHTRDYGADLSLTMALDSSPTAAVSITGRIFTPEGKGLRNARVTLTDQSGNTRSTISSPFGYYRFAELATGETYVVQVASKRYSFAAQIISVTEELSDLNFTANQ